MVKSNRRATVLFILLIHLSGAVNGCSRGPSIDASKSNSFELMTAAALAHRAGDVETAGFYFLTGQARYQIDSQVFPPQGQGGDSPGALKAALGATIGQPLQLDLANDPAIFAKVASRFAKWAPQFPAGYDPGWKFTHEVTGKDRTAIVTATLTPAVAATEAKAKLMDDAEYAQLSQVVKEADLVEHRYSQEQPKGRPVPQEMLEELRKARERKLTALLRMKEIEFELNPQTRWHALAGWKAEDYFDDAQVVALCRAIEANDLKEMQRLITAGADVKAIGKQGMTPLLWAFPDRKIDRFHLLLEQGADPNVIIESDFGLKGRAFHPYPGGGTPPLDHGCSPGQSVTHLAARSVVIDYLRLVLEHGADPNLLDRGTAMTPLDIVLDRHLPDEKERVELLVAKNANLNHYCEYRAGTPVMLAVREDLYDVALFLLESGADPKLYRPDDTEKLIHIVAGNDRLLPHYRQELTDQHKALVDWLEEHGESLDQARADTKAWNERFEKAMGTKGYATIRQEIIREQRRGKRPEAVPLMQLPEPNF